MESSFLFLIPLSCCNSGTARFFKYIWKNRISVCYNVKLHKYGVHSAIDIRVVQFNQMAILSAPDRIPPWIPLSSCPPPAGSAPRSAPADRP